MITNFNKYIKESNNSQFFTTYEETKEWLDKMWIKKYKINSDLTVDVNGDVDLEKKYLSYIPVKFGIVNGYFECSNNQLTSLNGSPKEVKGYFDCSYNQLTTLNGSPKEVKGNFYCSYNLLTSLEGAPKEVDGDFYCGNNTKKFTEDDVRAVCKVNGRIYV